MSTLGLFLVGSFAACFGLAVALAFARAVLYANVLTGLGRTHGLPRELHPGARFVRRAGWDVEDVGEPAPIRPEAGRVRARSAVSSSISHA